MFSHFNIQLHYIYTVRACCQSWLSGIIKESIIWNVIYVVYEYSVDWNYFTGVTF